MTSEDLGRLIEAAFDEMPLPDTSTHEVPDPSAFFSAESFLRLAAQRSWLQLRPLHQYVEHGFDFRTLAPDSYHYYLPAFLYAMVVDGDYEPYVGDLTSTLWYGGLEALIKEFDEFCRMPPAWAESELLRSVEQKLHGLEERQSRSDMVRAHRHEWETRVSIFTTKQKECIAVCLHHILQYPLSPWTARQIRAALDGYWQAFLPGPEALK